MATPNVVPNANNEGQLGKSGKQWFAIHAQTVFINGNPVASTSSPVFSGTPTAPTPAGGDHSMKIATTEWVHNELEYQGYLQFGAMSNGNIPIYDSGTGQMVDSTRNLAWLQARTNHTGQQATTSITNSPALAVGGASSIEDDFAWIAAQFSSLSSDLSGKVDTSHTHVSADITDATTSGAAGKLVKTGEYGGITGVTSNGLPALVGMGSVSSSGVYGEVSSGTGVGIHGHAEAGVSGLSAAGLFEAGPSHVKRTILALSHPTTQNPIAEFGEGDRVSWTTWGFIDNKGRHLIKNALGAYQKIEPSATAASDQSLYLPDADGENLVSESGAGISNPSVFRDTLQLGAGDTPSFFSISIEASDSVGVNFTSGAVLAMQDPSSTTSWLLPSGGGNGSVALVDANGNGLNASTFRTALGVVPVDGGTFTGTVTINPSSGSDQLILVGSNGFTSTISCNSTASRSISFPDASGTIVLGNGSGVTDAGAFRTAIGASAASHTHTISEVSDSGATGRNLVQAATSTVARQILGLQTSEEEGYASAFVFTAAETAIAAANAAVIVESGVFATVDAVNFSVPDISKVELEVGGAILGRYQVIANLSAFSSAHNNRYVFMLALNGSPLAATEVSITLDPSDRRAVSLCGILNLDSGTSDTVSVMVKNGSDVNNLWVEKASLVLRPL